MINIVEKILNQKIVSIYHNYNEQSLIINLDNNSKFVFYDCAIIFDFGLIGHTITYASLTGTLGMTFELKRLKYNPEDYNCIILSRDIKDYENKNEMVISYKTVKCKST